VVAIGIVVIPSVTVAIEARLWLGRAVANEDHARLAGFEWPGGRTADFAKRGVPVLATLGKASDLLMLVSMVCDVLARTIIEGQDYWMIVATIGFFDISQMSWFLEKRAGAHLSVPRRSAARAPYCTCEASGYSGAW
jgi:hypothetical protein